MRTSTGWRAHHFIPPIITATSVLEMAYALLALAFGNTPVMHKESAVVVELLVVLDERANHGKGLTSEQREKFNVMLETAKTQLANSGIKLAVSILPGKLSQNREGTRVWAEGLKSRVLNIVVTGTLPYGADRARTGGASCADDSRRFFITLVGVDDAGKGTLLHELSHHFTGDTKSRAESSVRRFVLNVVKDILNDLVRLPLQSLGFSIERYRQGAKFFARESTESAKSDK